MIVKSSRTSVTSYRGHLCKGGRQEQQQCQCHAGHAVHPSLLLLTAAALMCSCCLCTVMNCTILYCSVFLSFGTVSRSSSNLIMNLWMYECECRIIHLSFSSKDDSHTTNQSELIFYLHKNKRFIIYEEVLVLCAVQSIPYPYVCRHCTMSTSPHTTSPLVHGPGDAPMSPWGRRCPPGPCPSLNTQNKQNRNENKIEMILCACCSASTEIRKYFTMEIVQNIMEKT